MCLDHARKRGRTQCNIVKLNELWPNTAGPIQRHTAREVVVNPGDYRSTDLLNYLCDSPLRTFRGRGRREEVTAFSIIPKY